MQQNPLSRKEKPEHLRALDRLVVKALDIFTQLKKSRREAGLQPPENAEMVSVILEIQKLSFRNNRYIRIYKDIYGKSPTC